MTGRDPLLATAGGWGKDFRSGARLLELASFQVPLQSGATGLQTERSTARIGAMTTKTTGQTARTVFYAWQSDSPERVNRFFIRGALKKAIGHITKSRNGATPLEYDDATRRTAGSVMIVDSILNKIDRCDVFVGDISIISTGQDGARRVPNPNVLFEAGWAAARLGWNRVVLVFNSATGTLENDVPFDLRGRLILQYELEECTADRKGVEERLVGALITSIHAALDSPPPIRRKEGSRSTKKISREQQNERDRETLYRLLGRLDTQWLDTYLDNLHEERILGDAEVHFIVFTYVVEEARFHLFDRRTESTIRNFVAAWQRVHEATRYGDAIVGRSYVRFRPESYGHGEQVVQMRRELHDAREVMYDAYRIMVTRLHKTYPEFDLSQSDARTKEYIALL